MRFGKKLRKSYKFKKSLVFMFRQTKRKKLLTFVMSSLSVEHKNYAKFWNLPFDYAPLIRNQFSASTSF